MDADAKEPEQIADQTGLTPDQARLLLKADDRNLAQKLKEKKPLSAAQRNRLESIVSGGNAASVSYAKNQTELAEILGVNRKTVQRGLKRDGNPGVRPDGRLEVAAWREFLKLNPDEEEDDGEPIDGKRERARNVLLKNRQLEFRIKVEEGLYSKNEDVEKWVSEMIMTAKSRLLSGPQSLAPQVVGVSIPEAEKLISDWLAAAMSALHSNPLGEEAK